MKSLKMFFIFTLLLAIMVMACERNEKRQELGKKIKVVTTLFPLYDFAKNVGGGLADLSLLLPPGVEPHSFEPKPEDIVRINNADVFIYTNKYMEPWADSLLKGVDNKSLIVIDSSKGIKFIKETEEHGQGHAHKHEHEMDPHIWLDFDNAKIIIENILEGFIKADPQNAEAYRKNATQYKERLSDLDNKFREGLTSCGTRYFIHGGHYAFGYMAKRYGLNYISAYQGFSPNAEPSPKRLSELVKKMQKYNVKYVFYEELISPRVANTIVRETGASLLQLHAAHNLTKEEWDKGVTFIGLMEQTLINLRTGLQCK